MLTEPPLSLTQLQRQAHSAPPWRLALLVRHRLFLHPRLHRPPRHTQHLRHISTLGRSNDVNNFNFFSSLNFVHTQAASQHDGPVGTEEN